MHELENLQGELDVHQPAISQLDVFPLRRLLGEFFFHAIPEAGNFDQRTVFQFFPIGEGVRHLEKPLSELGLARHKAGAGHGLLLPDPSPVPEVGFIGFHRMHQNPPAALRAQVGVYLVTYTCRGHLRGQLVNELRQTDIMRQHFLRRE